MGGPLRLWITASVLWVGAVGWSNQADIAKAINEKTMPPCPAEPAKTGPITNEDALVTAPKARFTDEDLGIGKRRIIIPEDAVDGKCIAHYNGKDELDPKGEWVGCRAVRSAAFRVRIGVTIIRGLLVL
jgi:hypothetical protein